MTDRKEYMKAYYEANKEQRKANMKAWYEQHKEQHKVQMKAWEQSHKEEIKAYQKAYNESHKEERKEQMKAYYQAHKEERKAKMKAYNQGHKEQIKAYMKSDVNSLGQTKESIRKKSNLYLKKYGNKIPGYEIHHCCTYTEPYKFIYCSKEMHRLIHVYLRQHNIDADSNHYAQIKHLLDDTVVLYGLE